jgi:hypothetical protein
MTSNRKVLVLGALAASLVAAAVMLAVESHAPAPVPGVARTPTTIEASATRPTLWGHDVLHAKAAVPPAAPVVDPGIPAFSPPLATLRAVAPAPRTASPPAIPDVYAGVRPSDPRPPR